MCWVLCFWFVLFSYDTDNDHVSDNRTEISFWTWENITRIYYVHVFFWLNLELEKMLFESSNNVCLCTCILKYTSEGKLCKWKMAASHTFRNLGHSQPRETWGWCPRLLIAISFLQLAKNFGHQNAKWVNPPIPQNRTRREMEKNY